MPKKTSSKRKIKRSPRKNNSLLSKLFTLPKIITYGFAVLSLITFYQVTKPTVDVKGTSILDYSMYTKSQLDSMVQVSSTIPHYIAILLWKDANANAKMDGTEDCLYKTYSKKVNGVLKTRTQSSDCQPVYVNVSQDCNNVKFVDTFTNWYLTGIYAVDKPNSTTRYRSLTSDKLTNGNTIKVCGYPFWGEGYNYNRVYFGLKQN